MPAKVSIAEGAIGVLTRPVATKRAFLTLEGSVRFYFDGSTPTSTSGHLLTTGSQIRLEGSEITNFKAYGIESSTMQITYT